MKRNLVLSLFAATALAGVLPSAASAHGSISFSFDTYSVPYSDYSGYNDDDSYENVGGYDGYDDGYGPEIVYQQQRIQYMPVREPDYGQSYVHQGYPQSYGYSNAYPSRRYRGQEQRCHSGTTGAVVGAVVGGLLGREIGRGGAYNEPSTTGLILGAGGGALAGRAIGRSDCR